MSKLTSLKHDFLVRIGYVFKQGESADQVFNELRNSNPDLFPVPMGSESFWDAVRYATYTDAELAAGKGR